MTKPKITLWMCPEFQRLAELEIKYPTVTLFARRKRQHFDTCPCCLNMRSLATVMIDTLSEIINDAEAAGVKGWSDRDTAAAIERAKAGESLRTRAEMDAKCDEIWEAGR